MDSDYHQENHHSSPSKRIIESSSPAPLPPSPRIYSDYDVGVDNVEGDDDDEDVQASSPFQNNGRDDTVDFQRLMAMQRASAAEAAPWPAETGTPSGSPSGSPSGTPSTAKSGRKRSLDYKPEEQSKRVASGHGPEINVYVDGPSDAGTGHSNSMLERNEGMSTVMHENDTEEDGDGEDTQLSTFSAVPNTDMTSFARLSPTKYQSQYQQQQSPRRNLIDLGTPQSARRQRDHRENALRQSLRIARSPNKQTLLDFDLAPPTPRSIPTVTPRELETLKSGFMSEISSLRATLSGREAEVGSLKQAVADAERRVGEAMEEVRNEAARRETLEAEWTEARTDMLENERERERLVSRVEELETQFTSGGSGGGNTGGAEEVQEAVEKVARELHVLYKNKHETKVAALKKSYESRWEKRVREAEERAYSKMQQTQSQSQKECTRCEDQTRSQQAEKVLEAQIQGLQQEITTLREDQTRMATELQVERTEKGDLVAAVDEWLAVQPLSSSTSGVEAAEPEPEPETQPETQPELDTQPEPPRSEVKGIPKRKSGIAVLGRSGIMGSIERMGRNQQ